MSAAKFLQLPLLELKPCNPMSGWLHWAAPACCAALARSLPPQTRCSGGVPRPALMGRKSVTLGWPVFSLQAMLWMQSPRTFTKDCMKALLFTGRHTALHRCAGERQSRLQRAGDFFCISDQLMVLHSSTTETENFYAGADWHSRQLTACSQPVSSDGQPAARQASLTTTYACKRFRHMYAVSKYPPYAPLSRVLATASCCPFVSCSGQMTMHTPSYSQQAAHNLHRNTLL